MLLQCAVKTSLEEASNHGAVLETHPAAVRGVAAGAPRVRDTRPVQAAAVLHVSVPRRAGRLPRHLHPAELRAARHGGARQRGGRRRLQTGRRRDALRHGLVRQGTVHK